MTPRGIPDGVDGETGRRVLRTFLVVRIARGALLLIFLTIALVGVEVRGWPSGVMIAVALAMVAQAAALVVWCRRYSGAATGSPRAGPRDRRPTRFRAR